MCWYLWFPVTLSHTEMFLLTLSLCNYSPVPAVPPGHMCNPDVFQGSVSMVEEPRQGVWGLDYWRGRKQGTREPWFHCLSQGGSGVGLDQVSPALFSGELPSSRFSFQPQLIQFINQVIITIRCARLVGGKTYRIVALQEQGRRALS